MSIVDTATCGCCDNVRQYIDDHINASGTIEAGSDPVSLFSEIEEMYVGVDEGPGITLAHLEEYINSLEAEVEVEVEAEAEAEVEVEVEVPTTLVDTQVAAPEVTIEQLMNTPVQEPESNVIDLIGSTSELIRAIRFADLLIEEATEKYGLTPVVDNAKVVVSIQSKHKKARCIAWFSDPTKGQPYGWSNREGDEVYQEMNFTPEMLNHSTGDISATVIHEKVHKWCKALGVKDCALSGRHNKNGFAKYAEYVGLVVEPATDSYGWGYTSPSPELAERIEKELNLDVTKFDAYRLPVKKGKASNKLQKWVCTSGKESDCQAMYSRGDYEAVYVCHRCGEALVRAEPKGGDN